MKHGAKGTSTKLSRSYLAALRKHLASGSRASLQPARQLGMSAVANGLATLDLARIHEYALTSLVSSSASSRNGDGIVRRAAPFFVEALTPIEARHRTALQINVRLNGLNVSMRRQAAELAATNRRLTLEIARRKIVEKQLKKSARHYDQLLERSRRMQEHLRQLSHDILLAHEEERKKISRELHDEIGQSLTAINVMLATLTSEAKVNAKGLKKKVVKTQRLVEKSMKTIHEFARELRPPLLDDLGLIAALHSYLKSFTKRTRIVVRFTAFAGVETLDNDQRTALYRVAQEALTNVAKHAQASRVRVTIKKERGFVRLEVHDNGKSFEVERLLVARRVKRLGLIGMRERVEMLGGNLTIASTPSTGTTVGARIPVKNGGQARPAALVPSTPR